MPGTIELTPEEVIAKKLEDSAVSSKKSEEATKEASEVMKSVAANLATMTEVLKSESTKKEDSAEMLELKSDMALLKAKLEAKDSGSVGSKEALIKKSEAFVKDFAKALKSKGKVELNKENNVYAGCGVMEMKSLRTFDNTTAGALVPSERNLGEIVTNLQTISPVTSLVTNVNAGAITARELGYTTFDESEITITESNEMTGKEETKQIVRGEVSIHVTQNSAKVQISDKTVHSAEFGEFSTNPILAEFRAIERKFEKVIARKILNGPIGMGVNGIFSVANKAGTMIKKVATVGDNVLTLEDVAALTINLKGEYVRNSVFVMDRAALNDIYFEQGNDGHLKIEMFDYSNGLAALRTAEAIIPIIGVDSSIDAADIEQNDGFANYKAIDDGTTLISTGYDKTTGVDNKGKAVAILADWSRAYTLARSSINQVGYDDSFSDILNQGYVWGGKIGYVGGNVTNEESIAILYVK